MGQKKLVFTGGGTVGHVTLNLILIPKFIEDGWEVHYIGDKHGIECQEISQLEGVHFHSIATGKLRRYFSWQNLVDVFKVFWGIIQSLIIIGRLKPKALFSKGGFVSVPPVIATWLFRIPVFIHESDLSMGLANKIAYRFATRMYSTFEQSSQLSKVRHVGAITKISKTETGHLEQLELISSKFSADRKTLLFIGGSAGAKVFNQFVSQTPQLMDHYNVINITGNPELDQLTDNLYRVAYVTDLYQPLMGLADLVITRGGSNTLFELLAMQKLQIIVPLGREASRGDQLENAAYFVEKGYASQLAEDQLQFEALNALIEQIFAHQEDYYQAMANTKELLSPDEFYELLQMDLSEEKG